MLGRKGVAAMRILAMETTDKTGSVAAIDGDNLLAELMLDHTPTQCPVAGPRHRTPC